MLQPDGHHAPAGASSPPPMERRDAERHPCHIQTVGQETQGGPTRSGEVGRTWVVTVVNISTHGAGLLLKQQVKPGTVLVITLQSRNQRLCRPLPVRVMHVRPDKDDCWLHGCAFLRKLGAGDLEELLSGARES